MSGESVSVFVPPGCNAELYIAGCIATAAVLPPVECCVLVASVSTRVYMYLIVTTFTEVIYIANNILPLIQLC